MKHKGKNSDPIVGGVSEAQSAYWGKGEYANMPQDVKMKAYPKASQYGPDVLDDTMGNIDKENGRAESKSRKYVSNQH